MSAIFDPSLSVNREKKTFIDLDNESVYNVLNELQWTAE